MIPKIWMKTNEELCISGAMHFIKRQNNFKFYQGRVVMLCCLLSHVSNQHVGKPIDDLDERKNAEAEIESEDSAKTCKKVGESHPLRSFVL